MGESRPLSRAREAFRVAVLTTSYPLVPGSTSGIFVARLLGAMPDKVSVSIITPASRTKPAPSPKGNLRVLPVRYAPRIWQRLAHEPGGLPVSLRAHPWLHLLLPLLVAGLAFRTLREAPSHDLLHANWAFNGCVAGVIGILTGRPVLTSLRGEDVSRARKSWLARVTLRLALSLSRTIVAVSTDMAAWLRNTFPTVARKIVVVENGVDDIFFSVFDARRNRLPNAEPILVCIGNLIPRKGHAVLFRALARCASQPWKLQLAGEGTERAALKRLAGELGLVDRIEFLGARPPDTIPTLLADADVFVLPSFSEGRPNALLEAMAAGLTVVASAIDGVTELVDDGRTGRLFAAGDDQALSAVLIPLLQDSATRLRLGTAAHEEICTRELTWAGAAEKYARLYRQLVSQS